MVQQPKSVPILPILASKRFIDGPWQPQDSHKLPYTRHTKISSNAIHPHRTIPSPLAPLSLPLLLIPTIPVTLLHPEPHTKRSAGASKTATTRARTTHMVLLRPRITPAMTLAATKPQRRRTRRRITRALKWRARATLTPLLPRTSRATRPCRSRTLTRRVPPTRRRPGQSPARWRGPPDLMSTPLTLRITLTPGTTTPTQVLRLWCHETRTPPAPRSSR